MKTLFRMMALFMLLIGFTACEDDEETVSTLEVNYANLNGTWQLAEWNGQPLAEGIYCYITFVRKDKTYKMYQNLNSMYARCVSGTFTVENDDYLGYIISGDYDLIGEWTHSYIVTDLLPSGSMTWTVKDDSSDVSKYVRCDGVPSNIVEEAKDNKD